MVLDPVHVLCREAPVVTAEVVKTGEAITLDAARHVDIRLKITPNQLAQITKDGLSSMQTNIARTGD